jgi:hypothetical protein
MKLIRANINDCEKIWKMQKEAFADLLENNKRNKMKQKMKCNKKT